MKRLLISTAIATLIASGAALGADDKMKQEDTQAQAQPVSSDIQFVKAQNKQDWLASSLIGRAVQNSQGDTLGDINNVILDENGQVTAVLIGVGGFLGIGEKDVGVNYSALEFKEREKTAAKTQSTPSPQGSSQGNPMAGGQNATQSAAADREDEGHSNMVVVLNVTKKQLESAPEFTYLGDTPAPAEKAEPSSDKKAQ